MQEELITQYVPATGNVVYTVWIQKVIIYVEKLLPSPKSE